MEKLSKQKNAIVEAKGKKEIFNTSSFTLQSS